MPRFQGFLSATASGCLPILQINPTFNQSPDQSNFWGNLNEAGYPLPAAVKLVTDPWLILRAGRFGSALNCRTETDLCKVSTVQSLYAGLICIKIIEIHIRVSCSKGKVADVLDKRNMDEYFVHFNEDDANSHFSNDLCVTRKYVSAPLFSSRYPTKRTCDQNPHKL